MPYKNTYSSAFGKKRNHFTCFFGYGKEEIKSGGKVQEEPEEAGGRRKLGMICRPMNERRGNESSAERSSERSWTWISFTIGSI